MIDPNVDASGKYTREQFEREMLANPRQTAALAAKIMSEALNSTHLLDPKRAKGAIEVAAWCLVLINGLGFADRLSAAPTSKQAADRLKQVRAVAETIMRANPQSRRAAAGQALWELRGRYQEEFRKNRMKPLFLGGKEQPRE